MTLRHPVYFVYRNLQNWPELIGDGPVPSPDDCAAKFFQGKTQWTVQTYMRLKARGQNVHITDQYVPGQINVMHYDDLALRLRPDRGFVAVIQADRPRASAADVRIVQNMRQVKGPDDLFIQHWPQPGLKPRDPSRGASVKRVGYVGAPMNLAEMYRTPEFAVGLRDMGLEWVARFDDHSDFRDLDCILAVRDSTMPMLLETKPASKLINAWMAGCVAVLGEEPAYKEIRNSPLDYFQATTPGAAVGALLKLKDDPSLFKQMAEHGRMRAQDFSVERMTLRWEELLAGPITGAFLRWKEISAGKRTLVFGWRALQHKRHRRKFFKVVKFSEN
jgi:hypothetical protein